MALVATTSSRSWADFTDEACAEQEAPIYDSEKKLEMDAPKDREDLNLDVTGECDDLHEEAAPERGDQVLAPHQATGDLPSMGSAHHKAGRCKPCAFFHTKGCQNDKACLFCHLCPPGEKQRRKRLRERMCEKLGSNMGAMQKGTPFDLVDRRFKFEHARQASGASTCTSSTQSTCSGWSKFSHSRQSSGSSVVGWDKFSHSRQSSGSSVVMSPQEAGGVGMHQMPAHAVAGHHPHGMQQMMPVFHLHQPVAQPMTPTAGGYAAQFHASDWQKDMTQDEQASKAYSTTIELAQALPADTNAAAEKTPMAPHPPSPWNGSGLVQYALIPVPMSQLQHMHNAQGSEMPYHVCFSQYPQQQQQQQQQMQLMSPAAGQW
jgi:hypothetical protein